MDPIPAPIFAFSVKNVIGVEITGTNTMIEKAFLDRFSVTLPMVSVILYFSSASHTFVLEVGSGCGAITGALSRKAGSVTCVDLSKKRSLINAYRHSESENVTIHIGNFTDVEPDLPADYDYICLIGVFEYGLLPTLCPSF